MNKITIRGILAATILLATTLGLMPVASATHRPVKILIQVRNETTGKPARGIERSTDPSGTFVVDLICGSTALDYVRVKSHGTTVVRVLV